MYFTHFDPIHRNELERVVKLVNDLNIAVTDENKKQIKNMMIKMYIIFTHSAVLLTNIIQIRRRENGIYYVADVTLDEPPEILNRDTAIRLIKNLMMSLFDVTINSKYYTKMTDLVDRINVIRTSTDQKVMNLYMDMLGLISNYDLVISTLIINIKVSGLRIFKVERAYMVMFMPVLEPIRGPLSYYS
jgi:hypothetical protein